MSPRTRRGEPPPWKIEPINRSQFYFLLLASFVGLGVFTFPRDLTEQDPLVMWPAFALVCAMGAVGLAASLWLLRRLPTLRVVDAYAVVMGRAGGAAAILLIGANFCLAIILVRSIGDLMHALFLVRTPPALIGGALAAAAVYTASAGVQVMARALPIVVTLFLLVLIVAVPLGFRTVSYPFVELPHVWDPSGTVANAAVAAYTFFGFNEVQNLRAHVAPDDGVHGRSWMAYATAVLLLAFGLFLVAGTFTPWGTTDLAWPLAAQLRLLDLPGFFIDRLGLLILGAWTTMGYACLSVHLWGQAVNVRDLLKLPPGSVAWLVPAAGGCAWAAAMFAFANHQNVYWFVHAFVDPVGIGVYVGLPLIACLVAAARRLRTPTPAG